MLLYAFVGVVYFGDKVIEETPSGVRFLLYARICHSDRLATVGPLSKNPG